MDRVAATLEPLLRPRRIERMKSVLGTRSDHVAFVFEQMVDPHNLSAALRSLDAFSFQDAYLVDPRARLGFSRRITQGTERWLTLHEPDSLETCVDDLRSRGYRVLASHLQQGGAVSITELDFRQRVALVFGNEHEGVSDKALALSDGCFRIDMLGFVESLNLSVAVALCAHHARRELNRLSLESGEPDCFLLTESRRREIYDSWLKRSVRRSDEILAESAGRGQS